MSKFYELEGPQGQEIVGRYVSVKATVAIGEFDGRVDENGRFIFEDGDETDVHWESERQMLSKGGERLFLDKDTKIYKESELHVREVDIETKG